MDRVPTAGAKLSEPGAGVFHEDRRRRYVATLQVLDERLSGNGRVSSGTDVSSAGLSRTTLQLV